MEKRILKYLAENPAAKAKIVADALGSTRHAVNSVLYSLKAAGHATISSEFLWSLAAAESKTPMAAQQASKAPTIVILKTPAKPVPPPHLGVNSTGPTEEQLKVISAPPAARLMVEAGPGTGKTESLVNRLCHLTGLGGLSPANILVLSFSVAAVRELKTRIERISGKGNRVLSYVEIRTFDSFASRLLRSVIGTAALQPLNYDERIQRAVEELKKNPAAGRTLSSYKHLLLDEVQDLVGVRADFACELLAILKPGFTIFGDSAQGIYDFQLEGGPSATTSDELLRTVRKKFPDVQNTVSFTRNFRADGDARLQNISFRGRALLLESTDKARVFLEREFSALTDQGHTNDPKIEKELLQFSTCVVCRTNGQVLQLAGNLHTSGIPCCIARSRSESHTPTWVGIILFCWQDSRVQKAAFVAKAVAALSLSEAESIQLWEALVSACASPKAVAFDIADLRGALTDGAVLPDPFAPPAPDVVQLSTIHRSKGQEFANVIVVMGKGENSRRRKDEDVADEAAEPRVLFVALTRAKKSLRKMQARSNGEQKARERWIRTFTMPNGFKSLSGIEAGLTGDLDLHSFVAGDADDAAEAQTFLREKVKPGVSAELWFVGMIGGWPLYKVMVAKVEIGRMSENFGWAVWHTLKNLNNKPPKSFPVRIENLWVRDIVTVVGDLAAPGVDRSLLTAGLWLAPNLEGLGQCKWK